MAYRDLRHFIEKLETERELRRIPLEVSQDLEITEFAQRGCRHAGPALLFEKVTGHTMPVLLNAFASERRMALALEVGSMAELTAKIQGIIDLAKEPPAPGIMGKLRALPKLMELASSVPSSVSDGVCKEVILTREADLTRLPVLKCWPGDGGRFITLPQVITRDPDTGKRNVGMYRMQVYGPREAGMHWQRHKDGARHGAKALARGARIPCAVALGCDPAVTLAGALPLPPDLDELIFAGVLRGESVRMVKCETQDLEVPANAEIVLEGTVDPADQRIEGPFGDHTGYYSLEDRYPTFHLTAITHRRNPIYQTIVVGPPPQEDCWMGLAIEKLFLPLMRMQLPEIVDVSMPFEGVFHNLILISIRKAYPGHARKIMHAVWGMGQAMFSKVVVVFDADVNVHDHAEVAWKGLNHIDPQRDFEFSMGPMDVLDHASRLCGYGSKVGIDATRKWPDEGFTRPWPDECRMTPEVKELVARKWTELGL